MTSAVTHPLVNAYLRDLELLLHGVDASERAEVLAGVHEHLDATLPPGSSIDDVRGVLAELGSPQSVADAAYAGRPAPAPLGAPPARTGRSPWLAYSACLINGIFLLLISWLGLAGAHLAEIVIVMMLLWIPWVGVIVLTALTDLWTAAEKLRSIAFGPAVLVVVAVTTWIVRDLLGWWNVGVVASLAVSTVATLALTQLARSAQRRADGIRGCFGRR